tara:strand:+ start:970 stop:1125 length:156 start_codon:yes stop_codon:yes gene_type:complete
VSDVEIEIKLPLQNPETVKAFLEEHATAQDKEITQKDTYYTPSQNTFIPKM